MLYVTPWSIISTLNQDSMDLVSLHRQSLLAEEAASHEKNSFWASDSEKNGFDIYHAWMGTEPTNPFDAKSLWRFKCGKSAEEKLIELFKEREVMEEGGDQYRTEFEWNGIPISGYADIKLKTGEICEVKSYYGDYMAKDLTMGKPKTNYLKQLAVYMYAEKLDRGILYMVPMPMGEHYQFYLRQVAQGEFELENGLISFNLEEEFARWKKLYNENIVPKIEPKSEYRYKYPVETLDWRSVPKGDISKARNGHKVLGSWQVTYSPYMDLIIAQEGSERGYTLKELEIIKEKTQGFSNWK